MVDNSRRLKPGEQKIDSIKMSIMPNVFFDFKIVGKIGNNTFTTKRPSLMAKKLKNYALPKKLWLGSYEF